MAVMDRATTSEAKVPPDAGTLLPRGAVARTVAKVRAHLRREQLDRALAAGVEPWMSGPLMTRAAKLTSPSTRHKLAGSIDALLVLAGHGGRPIAEVSIAHREVLDQREAFCALAARLRDPAPAGVAGLALLAELLWQGSSPVYDRHSEPGAVAAALGRCLALIEPAGVPAFSSAPDDNPSGGG
jgi:hypothetical protein